MSLRHLILAATLSAAVAVPTLALAAPPAARDAHCLLNQHRVTKVQPLRAIEGSGRGTHERLAGAQVFVQAEPGLTAEWLDLTIRRHIGAMASMPNCPLDMQGVQVKVESAGPGFVVKLSAKGNDQAKELLRRAQLLVG